MLAFQWPEFDFKGDTDVEIPGWVRQEIKDGNIRVVDTLAHVCRYDGDWLTVRTGEWIVKMGDRLTACSEFLFASRRAPVVDLNNAPRQPEGGFANADNAQVEGADAALEPPPAGGPPYSSAVLARSASAREQQAIYDANQPNPKPNPR